MSTIYERIRARRIELGLTVEELAKKMGYKDKSSISKIENGKADIPQSKVIAFARALNTTTAYLMGIDTAKEISIPAGFQPLPKRDRIPRVGQIACGTPILAEENVEAYDEVPSDWHADFTLLCQGDSMEPKIKDGDVVAIHSQPMVENGEVAAVLIDGEATLKRVFLFDDHIELRAENPTFPTILRIGEDMNTITIEGKAVGLCRKL
ncbi:LexA family transcriptional regulator [Gemmiger formicilis]|jgi:repressor LexA|uniref:LexA family protein n=1 Tax=Gemmiger formicilis TaxID=745368 RepID=UPI0030799351